MEIATYQRFGQLEIIHLKNKALQYKEHNHVSVYTIGLVLHGKIDVTCNGVCTQYSSGGLFSFAPYQIHALLLPQSYDLFSVCIKRDLVETHKPQNLLDKLTAWAASFPVDINDAQLAAAVEAVYKCKEDCLPENTVLPGALFLRQNPEKSVNVSMLARQAKYSPCHYIKLFEKYVGISPHKFQLQNRVRKAQKMLENGEASASVAVDLGFYDQSHFIKCFKGFVGFTPKEYQRAIK